MLNHRFQIAVCGSAEVSDPDVAVMAETIGTELAKTGSIILTGATTGYPWHAAKAAKEAGGLSIGFSPAENRDEHTGRYAKPTDAFDFFVFSGFGYEGRNTLLVRSADAVIFIGGRIGTVNEFTAAYQSNKLIGLLTNSGGTIDLLPKLAQKSNKAGGMIIQEPDPVKLTIAIISKLTVEGS